MNYTKEEIKHRNELRAFLIVDGKKAFIEKYGADKVARLGTISRYKAKSTITEVARIFY